MSSTDFTTLAENAITLITETVKALADGVTYTAEQFGNMMRGYLEKHKDNIAQNMEFIADEYKVKPEDIKLEVQPELDANNELSFENGVTMDIVIDDKYYGKINVKDDRDTRLIHHEGVAQDTNELSEFMEELNIDAADKNEAMNWANEYKSDGTPEQESLKEAGFNKDEIEEMQADKSIYDKKLAKQEVKAIKAEIFQLKSDYMKLDAELKSLTGNEEETRERITQKMEQKKEEIGKLTVELADAKDTKKEMAKEYRRERINAGLNTIRSYNNNIRYTCKQIKDKTVTNVKTALNNLQNFNDRTNIKYLSVEYSVNRAIANFYEKQANKLKESYMKRNDRVSALKTIFTGKRHEYTSELKPKQQAKVNEVLDKARPYNKNAKELEAEINQTITKMKERNENLRDERAGRGMKESKSVNKTLDDVCKDVKEKFENLKNKTPKKGKKPLGDDAR